MNNEGAMHEKKHTLKDEFQGVSVKTIKSLTSPGHWESRSINVFLEKLLKTKEAIESLHEIAGESHRLEDPTGGIQITIPGHSRPQIQFFGDDETVKEFKKVFPEHKAEKAIGCTHYSIEIDGIELIILGDKEWEVI